MRLEKPESLYCLSTSPGSRWVFQKSSEITPPESKELHLQ